MNTIGDCLQRSSELAELSDSAELDTQLLLCHVIAKPRSYLIAFAEQQLTTTQYSQFEQLFERRLNGEPVAYIVEQQGFWSLDLTVNATTLIPRPETELLVELCLDELRLAELADKPTTTILDLGTGSGAIALALAKELPQARVIGVDVDEDSVALAKQNAERNNITNAEFYQSSWYNNVSGQFAVIVSNPPYIAPDDEHLSQGDVRFEPLRALVADDSGLADIRLIASQAKQFLLPQGLLLVEHGYDQGEAVQKIFTENGFSEVTCQQDLSGNDRVTSGRWQG